MFQFHEIGGFRIVFCLPSLLDSRLHLEPSILPDYCNVKPLEQARLDTKLQLAFQKRDLR